MAAADALALTESLGKALPNSSIESPIHGDVAAVLNSGCTLQGQDSEIRPRQRHSTCPILTNLQQLPDRQSRLAIREQMG
jgi:hypothetical protein